MLINVITRLVFIKLITNIYSVFVVVNPLADCFDDTIIYIMKYMQF